MFLCSQVREMLRLSGFPDSFRVVGSITEQVKQSGNIVAFPVGRAAGQARDARDSARRDCRLSAAGTHHGGCFSVAFPPPFLARRRCCTLPPSAPAS